jgi:hypothetical protein
MFVLEFKSQTLHLFILRNETPVIRLLDKFSFSKKDWINEGILNRLTLKS